jgi:hypothetical protein
LAFGQTSPKFLYISFVVRMPATGPIDREPNGRNIFNRFSAIIQPMNIQLTVPFFMVADMERSLRFYTDGLGFAITKQWTPKAVIEWCWLERDAVAIMLQQPRKPNPEQQGPLGGGVTITHQCADESLGPLPSI